MTTSLGPRWTTVLLLLLLCLPLDAQVGEDTLGSLLPDAPVTLLDGSAVSARDLRAGTVVWTWVPGGQPAAGQVTAIRRVHSDSYIWLKAGEKELQATGSHRIAVAGGKLVRLDTIREGQRILVWGPKGPQEAAVTSIRNLPITLVTYDLTIEGHRMFLIDGILVGD